MKNLIFALIAIISMSSIIKAQTSSTDFRSFNWGSSLSQVQSAEKSKFVKKEKDDLLIYEDNLAGADCEVIFQFNDYDKLIDGTYIFTSKHSNPQLYIDDYNKFKDLLISKYGNPKSEKEAWNINTPSSTKDNFGQAISDGNLTLNSNWTSDRSLIKISLVQLNQHPSLQIYYTAKSISELENKDELKKALLKL